MRTIKAIIGFLGLGAVIALGTGCSDSGQSGQATVDTVEISQMAFHPADIKIKKGDTIIWINKDIVTHDVTESPDQSWTSGNLNPGDTFKKAIDGSFDYICSLHPTMEAKVTVE